MWCGNLVSATFMGNAPFCIGVGAFEGPSCVFDHSPATVYCYQGAAGFGTNFQCAPVFVIATGTNPPVILGNLSQTYDGTAKTVTATATLTNVAINLTYNGNSFAPTNVGSYTVVGTISDANYAGSATNTLVISKAVGVVNLTNLFQPYTGGSINATEVTVPTNLLVRLTYNGSANAPTNVGSYTVIGTVDDPNYLGGATNTLVIQAIPVITAAPVPSAITYGQTLASSVLNNGTASVPGSFSFILPDLAPLAGTTNVQALFTPNDTTNYSTAMTNVNVVVNKAWATVSLGALYQNYDGSTKCANFSTTPSGLFVNLAYNGSATCPSAVGSYTVVGIILDMNYQGSATNILSISAIAPVITQHPQSQAVETGSNCNLTVIATGAPLYYQWFKGGSNLNGAISSALTFNPVDLTNAGNYFVVVSNNAGVAVSSNAVFAVRPPGAPIIRVDGDLVVGSISKVGSAIVTMENTYVNGQAFYTLNGITPDFSSALYSGPITLTTNVIVRALGLDLDSFDSAESPAVAVNIRPTYGLTLTTNGSGTISANPSSGPYASNAVVMVTASPSANWQFNHWAGDATGSANPIGITMNGPRTVQAVFIQVAYPVVTSTLGGGSVGADPLQAYYLSNTVVNVTATASNGWMFVGWTGSVNGTNNPLSLAVNRPISLAAVFATTVKTNVLGSGIIELNATNPIPYGTLVRATGVPNYGSYFVSWGSALTGTNNPAELSVTTTNPVRALFTTLTANNVSLTVRINGSGDVTVSPRKAYYSSGDSVTISATPRGSTNQFINWSGDFVSTTNTTILTLNTSKVVTANFSSLVLPTGITSSLTATGVVGTTFNYQIAASNNPTSFNASGLPLGLAVNTTNGLISGTPVNAGSYSVTISASNAGGTGSATLMLNISAPVYPPTIVQSPSDQTASSGTTVTFTEFVTGTVPLNYQWYKNGAVLPGATNASLVLANVTSTDAAAYDVVVTNAYGSATSAIAHLTIYDAPAAHIFIVPTNGISGQTVDVPILLNALGNENGLSFTLNYNPAVLRLMGLRIGANAGTATLLENTNNVGLGQVGVILSLPVSKLFAIGTQQIAVVQFYLNPVTSTNGTMIGFGDQPVMRVVASSNGSALTALYQGAIIAVAPGNYKGDVYPPGTGDHQLNLSDWIREGRLLAGLEKLTDYNEFIRADCAPRAKSDGALTVADWVQVGRYAAGLDPYTIVGVALNNQLAQPVALAHSMIQDSRTIYALNTNANAGSEVMVPVLLNALGGENAVGFTVNFDISQLSLLSVLPGSGVGGASFNVNTNMSGTAGMALALSAGTSLGSGVMEIAELNFQIMPNAHGQTAVSLSDAVVQREVVDATAQTLTTSYIDGSVDIAGVNMLSISVTNGVVNLVWPSIYSNYSPQSISLIGSGLWNSNLGQPSFDGTNYQLTLPATNQQQFFRISQ